MTMDPTWPPLHCTPCFCPNCMRLAPLLPAQSFDLNLRDAKAKQDEVRAVVVRALVAQAWGVACAVFAWQLLEEFPTDDDIGEGAWDAGFNAQIHNVALLPSPAELADELLGEA